MSKEEEDLVLSNQGLVHMVVRKMGKIPGTADYEDLASVGMIGLCKGAKSFDPNKGFKPSSYLSRCITNEIMMSFRTERRMVSTVSYDTLLPDAENDLTFLDILEDVSVDIEEEIVREEDYLELTTALHILSDLELYIVNHVFELNGFIKKKEKELAEILGISQSYVNRVKFRAIKKMRRYLQTI